MATNINTRLERQIAAQALEWNGRRDGDGNDECHQDAQPDRIHRHRIAARVEQGLQDSDVVVELGEPERQRDQHDPQAVDDDRPRNGQQDEGQDSERRGRVARHVDADHDQDRCQDQIPGTPDRDARERDQEHAVDGLEQCVIHRAVADALVEFFSVRPDQGDHQGMDETEHPQQRDQFAEVPAADGFRVVEDDTQAEQFPAQPHQVKQDVDNRIGTIGQRHLNVDF